MGSDIKNNIMQRGRRKWRRYEHILGFPVKRFRDLTNLNMVVMSSTESSSFSLTFPPISDVVFVMEETTATSLYLMSEMRDNYIVPTLENFGEWILLSSSVWALIVVKVSLKYLLFIFTENGGEDKRHTPSWAQIRCSSTFTIILYRGPVCRLG